METIKSYALENNVPIISDEVKNFICDYIKTNQVKEILEIGSAIGYSALCMSKVADDIKIDTIERNIDTFNRALYNLKEYDLNKQIRIFNEDALLIDMNQLKEEYDLIFVDGAKAQSQKFIEKYESVLKKDGVMIIDNVDFHGFVKSERTTNNRNTRQLVGKIRRFIDWLESSNEYQATYYEIGDGLYVIRKENVYE